MIIRNILISEYNIKYYRYLSGGEYIDFLLIFLIPNPKGMNHRIILIMNENSSLNPKSSLALRPIKIQKESKEILNIFSRSF